MDSHLKIYSLRVDVAVWVVDGHDEHIVSIQERRGVGICSVASQEVVDAPQAGGWCDPSDYKKCKKFEKWIN